MKMKLDELRKIYLKDPKTLLSIDSGRAKRIKKNIENFIKSKASNGAVIGLSGGLDSTTCARLSVNSLGRGKVLGLILPSKSSLKKDVKDAKDVAESLGIKYKCINIDKAVNEFFNICPAANKVEKGNIRARVRMIILRHYAHHLNRIVIGTGNKSEIACGYFTKNGDAGVDILPIGDLYKTEVKQLAAYLKVPEKIIRKVPSAGLWKGQTDEKEIGIGYAVLDEILLGLDLGLPARDISRAVNVKKRTVERVIEIKRNAKHKLELPVARLD